MDMTPFLKNLLTLIFNIAVLVLVGYLIYFIAVWAASIFAIPFTIVSIIGFLIFIYVAYRVIMLLIAFFNSNAIK